MNSQVRARAIAKPAAPLTPCPPLQLVNSSSSSSPNSINPPPLLRLSNEILSTIFAFACELGGNRPSTRKPICRRLLPFQRAQLYRRVQLRSYKALTSFRDTVTGSSSIAGSVRHLYIEAGDDSRNIEADDEDAFNAASERRRLRLRSDCDDRKIVTPVDFAALVPSLNRLESLETLALDEQLLDVVFLDQEASRSLSSLQDVECARQEGRLVPDECDAGRWVQRLSCLPRLANLTLRQWCIDRPIVPAMPAPPSFPYLTRLVLQAGPTSAQPSWIGPALDKMAPNLVELELEDWKLEWFTSALATAPVGLRILSLINTSEFVCGGTPSRAPVNDVLGRFKNLEQLRLGHGALDMSEPTAGLNALLALDKLQHLIFDDTDLLSDSFLLALLSNPNHLPNLATLELNHVVSTRGRTVKSMHGALPPRKERRQHSHWPMWGDWVAPWYVEGCSERGQLEVWTAAVERGVLLEGEARTSIDWRDAFEAEQSAAHLALGDLTGDYLRARPVLGNDVVDAHILARMRARTAGGEGGEAGEGGEV